MIVQVKDIELGFIEAAIEAIDLKSSLEQPINQI